MSTLLDFSNDLASLGAAASPSVLQVLGARRPASGTAHGTDTILTNARALGRDDGLRVRLTDGTLLDASLAGWDPASGLAVLRTARPHGAPVLAAAAAEARPGQLAVALARSWSNTLTVSLGVVAVVGGPLRTGRRRQLERVIRITAPLHEGFAGGPVLDPAGAAIGIATAATIRGFAVVVPASIAWAAAERVLASGTPRRGFVGLAVQSVELPEGQRTDGRGRALLVMGVTPGSPADRAGVIVGDLLLDFDGHPLESADDLLDRLSSDKIGQTVEARTLRGGAPRAVSVTVGSRD